MDKTRLQELGGVELTEALRPGDYSLEVDADSVAIMVKDKEIMRMSTKAWMLLMKEYSSIQRKRD